MITCPVNQTINTEPSKAYASVSWTDPQVTDNSGQIPTITCDAESGSQFDIGETGVTCQAVDPTGNQETCTFTVKIKGKQFTFVYNLCVIRFHYDEYDDSLLATERVRPFVLLTMK